MNVLPYVVAFLTLLASLSAANDPSGTYTATYNGKSYTVTVAETGQQPPAQQPKDLGILEIDATHPWPQTNPFPAAKAVEVDVCQYGVGLYEPAGTTRWFDLSQPDGYVKMTVACLTGKGWFKDFAPQGTKFENAVVVPPAVADCAKLVGRDNRLNCVTAKYYAVYNANGDKLAATRAMLDSLGVTYDDLAVNNPYQPDATVKANGPQIWGALVKTTNMKVTGNVCLVSDVSSLFGPAGWLFSDSRYNPSVLHVGETTTVGNQVEIAVHFDCTDWFQVLAAMKAAGYTPAP